MTKLQWKKIWKEFEEWFKLPRHGCGPEWRSQKKKLEELIEKTQKRK